MKNFTLALLLSASGFLVAGGLTSGDSAGGNVVSSSSGTAEVTGAPKLDVTGTPTPTRGTSTTGSTGDTTSTGTTNTMTQGTSTGTTNAGTQTNTSTAGTTNSTPSGSSAASSSATGGL